MSFTLNGTIKEIKEYYFTILVDGDNKIKFRPKDNSLKNYNIGSSVEVQFVVKGSLHNEKYYVSLDAFKVSLDKAPD